MVVAAAVLVLVLIGLLALHAMTVTDGTPDDRLLATMEHVASEAQTVLDETGELPASLAGLARAAFAQMVSAVSYHRLGAASIRLCGEFEQPSSGQTIARPLFDVFYELRPELTAPRPARGRHCYDITLEQTEPAEREDALLFREMNDAATATECVYFATGVLPATTTEVKVRSERHRPAPGCFTREFLNQPRRGVERAPTDAVTMRLCATFHRGYHPSDKPARVFDPRRDARFPELTQARPEPGRRCYTISVLRPDPRTEAPTAAWDEPIGVEELPVAIRAAAVQDRKAIGDVVNVLRLARCAFTMGDAAPSSIEEAIRTVALRPKVADRFDCDWAPHYFAAPYNAPVAAYEPVDKERVRVCAQFRGARERPLALNYYGAALTSWPTSLPELQRSIPKPGRHCFTVRLTPIGSGVT